MKKGKRQFLIKNQTAEKVKLTLAEFENKYQNFKSRWDFELVSQRDHMVSAQIVDHGYETPREKGQSDSPLYDISLQEKGQDVLLSWCFHWKPSKRRLSWLLLWILAAFRAVIFITVRGDRTVLFMGIWAFWGILYGAWLLQNYTHDQESQNIFLEMLTTNFPDGAEPIKEQNDES